MSGENTYISSVENISHNGTDDLDNREFIIKQYFYKNFVDKQTEDKLIRKIVSLGLVEDLFSVESKFIREFDISKPTYTSSEAGDLFELKSGGQRLINILNDKNRNFYDYLDPSRIANSYKFEHITMFKFHMILFLLGQGYDINDVAEWQGLIAASSKPRMTRSSFNSNSVETNNFENQEMIIQLVGKFVEAVKELQTDNVNFMEKLVDYNEEAAAREINAMITHLESKNTDVEKSKEHITYLKENVLQPLIKREWSINEKIARNNNGGETSISAPVKKSFFQKLFGGGEVTPIENKEESLQDLKDEQQTLLTEISNTNTEIEKLQIHTENGIKEAGELQALIAHIKEQKVDRIADLKAEIPTIDSLPLLNTLINASNKITEPKMEYEQIPTDIEDEQK
ncbi:hypothetical protein ACIQYL_20965 [Lysinibacillus xylanilyticus]|uniref:hypothetical protein n=1 Tax=Lysinibacillus xylanilyticus TaxID=582475 RepID=UPI003808B46E